MEHHLLPADAFGHDLSGKSDRTPADQAELSVDERSGQADESHDKGRKVKRFQNGNHDQLRTYLTESMAAYNFTRR